jgi:hypothetical protein
MKNASDMLKDLPDGSIGSLIEAAAKIREEAGADLRKMEDAIVAKAAAIIAKRIEDAAAEEYVLDVFIANVQAIVQGQTQGGN